MVISSGGPQTKSSEVLSVVMVMGSEGAISVSTVDGKSLSGFSAQSRSPLHPYEALLNKSSGVTQLVTIQFSVTSAVPPMMSAPKSKQVYPGCIMGDGAIEDPPTSILSKSAFPLSATQ